MDKNLFLKSVLTLVGIYSSGFILANINYNSKLRSELGILLSDKAEAMIETSQLNATRYNMEKYKLNFPKDIKIRLDSLDKRIGNLDEQITSNIQEKRNTGYKSLKSWFYLFD